VAQFAVRIYRAKDGGYVGTIDGFGSVEGGSLAETVRNARAVLSRVLTGAFPDRKGIDPAGADLVVWFEVVLERRTPQRNRQNR